MKTKRCEQPLLRGNSIWHVAFSALLLLMGAMNVSAQVRDSADFFTCCQAARVYHPKADEKEMYMNISKLRIDNLRRSFYPQLDVKAQYSWQSEVIALDIDLPFPADLPTSPQGQYKVVVDLAQTIYDGGLVNGQKLLEQAQNGLALATLESELYGRIDQVSNVYFAVLVFQQSQRQLEITIKSLSRQLRISRLAVANGVLTADHADQLEAEILALDQQRYELNASRRAGLEMLALLTGMEFHDSTELGLPQLTFPTDTLLTNRPEFAVLDCQSELIRSQASLLQCRRMPRLMGFAQAGYGNPGLNMLEEGADSWLIAGLRLQYPLLDWNQTQREKQVLKIKTEMIDNQRELLTQQLRLHLAKVENERLRLEAVMNGDQKLLALRENIKNASLSRLNNGVIPVTDYIRAESALLMAALSMEMHLIQYAKNMVDYQIATGELTFLDQ